MQSTIVKPANILELALDEGSLNTFVQAVQGTDLNQVLAGEGPFTVFAPVDEAFRQYSSASIGELLGNRDELSTLLSYHIVPGCYRQADLKKSGALKTLLGKDVEAGSIRIQEPDIECSNGILHVISGVLIP